MRKRKSQPNHPGIAHYLIHSYDFAPLAAMCVSTAQLYDKIAAAAPHALHMPSHIYSMLGMWEDSVRSNLACGGGGRRVRGEEFPRRDRPEPCPTSWISLSTPICRWPRTATRAQVVDSAARSQEIRDCALAIDTALGGHSGALCTRPRPLGRGGAIAGPRQPISGGAVDLLISPARSAPRVPANAAAAAPKSRISTRSKPSLPRQG